jgi:hypothetical protein
LFPGTDHYYFSSGYDRFARIPAFYGHALVVKGISFGGSLIGPPAMIKEMLDVAVKHNVKAWTSSHPMNEVGQKLKDMDDGKGESWVYFLSLSVRSSRLCEWRLTWRLDCPARYRFVMTNP